MGEVYRAHDPQLGRDVALKVIGGPEAPDAGQLRRLETEARAVAALRHPHILEVHDVGVCDGRPFVVFELLEGESLGQRLARGAMPARKAVEIAVQVCAALAAAHARGVVHRDLKPDNLFLVPEGVKVLDFGVAKLADPLESAGAGASVQTATDVGMWVGTPGYVSPEQLRGQAATSLSDVFALGAVLYEMLTGHRAFRGATRADTLTAVLQQDPPPMTIEGGRTVAPALERVVRRCLEKDPEDRFQSARDVAFALEAFVGTGMESGDAVRAEPHRRARAWLVPLAVVAAVVVVAAFATGVLVERRRPEAPAPTFRPLTFRRGWMQQARFAPDGRTVIYAAAWDGQPLSLYETRTDSAESRPLGISHANVLAVSAQGTMAFVSNRTRDGMVWEGTLATAPIGGTAAAPREVLGDAYAAEWTRDGRLFVAVWRGHETTLELPPGNVVFRLPGGASFARLSPDGRYVAFSSGMTRSLVVLDLQHRSTRTLVERLTLNFWGLAWSPSGREVWFTDGPRIDAKDVWAVDLSGRRRLGYRSAVDLSLLDIAPDGRALLHRSFCRSWAALFGRAKAEQEFSVGNASQLLALSANGRDVLLQGETGVFLRRLGAEPLQVAEGQGQDLSPDGGAVLVVREGRLDWVPTGAGVARTVETGISRPIYALFVPPDGKRAFVQGVEPDGQPTPYRVVPIESGPAVAAIRPLTPPVRAVTILALSPDGRLVAGVWKDGTLSVLPLDGSAARDLGSVPPDFRVTRWSEDGRSIFLTNPGQDLACTLARFDLAPSRFEPLRNVGPADTTGVNNCNDLIPSGDGTSGAASYTRCLTDLVLAEGLR